MARNLGTHSTWIQGRLTGMRARVSIHLSMGDSGLDADTFNIVSGACLTGARAAQIAGLAANWYDGRRFSWWVCPGDLPTELPSVLEGVGLRRVQEAEAMTCDLRSLTAEPRWPSDLTVSRVRTASDLRAYAELLAGLTDPMDPHVLAFYAAAEPVLLRTDCPLRLYLGSRGPVPVATSEATISHGVAGLYNVSTASPQRGQGIGTALSVLPLLEAREEGIMTAVLQAEGEARRVYARIGFESAGVVAEYNP
jgi:GNAT superfamily N-acetyltransferase